jgi:hypothetical protein
MLQNTTKKYKKKLSLCFQSMVAGLLTAPGRMLAPAATPAVAVSRDRSSTAPARTLNLSTGALVAMETPWTSSWLSATPSPVPVSLKRHFTGSQLMSAFITKYIFIQLCVVLFYNE